MRSGSAEPIGLHADDQQGQLKEQMKKKLWRNNNRKEHISN